jgi:hypothetical protein
MKRIVLTVSVLLILLGGATALAVVPEEPSSPALAGGHTLFVAGAAYGNTHEAGTTFHWEAPNVPVGTSVTFPEREQTWSGQGYQDCEGGLAHWISNENNLVQSGCVEGDTTTSSTTSTTSTTTTSTTSTTTTTTLPPGVPTLFAAEPQSYCLNDGARVVQFTFGDRPDLDGRAGTIRFNRPGTLAYFGPATPRTFVSGATVTVEIPNIADLPAFIRVVYFINDDPDLEANGIVPLPTGPTCLATGTTTTTTLAPPPPGGSTTTTTTVPGATTTTVKPAVVTPAVVTPAAPATTAPPAAGLPSTL